MEKQRKTWFITGGSKGIGLELARQLLASGYNVAATSRDAIELEKVIGSSSSQFLPLQVDLAKESSVQKAVSIAIAQFGCIDVLVNNAGYGLIGGIEESSDQEARLSFDVNVFGLLNVTRAVLPHMRTAKSGHIINISSVFGLIAGAGWGIYCATKFAVEGLSEALAQEVKPFGIDVTIIEPGYIRTNFLSGGSITFPKNNIADYTELTEEKRKHKNDIPGNQPGDPKKVVKVLIDIASRSTPPLRLLLGSDALQFADYKLKMLRDGIEQNKDVTLSTDFE